MLTDELITAGAEEAAHHEGNDQDVVELADDGNEIGHEVEGQREIRDDPIPAMYEQIAPAVGLR